MPLPFYLDDPGPHNYAGLPYLYLDFETTNKDYGDSRNPQNSIVMCCVRGKGDARAHEVDPKAYPWPETCILVAHNAKFELGWLRRLGVDTSQWLCWDTMLGEYVLAGNRKWDLSLGATCARYGLPGKHGLVDTMMEAGICPSDIPHSALLARCKRDVGVLVQIQERQRAALEKDGLMAVFFTRNIVTPVLSAIEAQGVCLDSKLVEEEYEKEVANKARLETTLSEISGGANLRSGKQLGQVLYDTLGFPEPKNWRGEPSRTAAGGRKTDAGTIAGLKATTPEQKAFAKTFKEYRKADSALAKTLEFFRGICADFGGVFYGNFNQAVTATHRLSSSGKRIRVAGKLRGVQFQNLPRDYKRLFWSGDPDYAMVEADGIGLEFRVAAELGDDPQALADIKDGKDVHAYTASVIFSKPEETVTPKERTAAKSRTFKPLFSEGTTGTPREVKYYKAFKAKYQAITDTQATWVAEAMRHGKIRLPSGLWTYHKLTIHKSGFIEGANQVRNIPIQSFATADIIPVSLVYTFWIMRAEKIDGALVNTIHDSIVGYVRKKQVDKFHEIVVECFLARTYAYIEKVYGRVIKVPLGVGFKSGDHWGEGEEIKVSKEYGKHG